MEVQTLLLSSGLADLVAFVDAFDAAYLQIVRAIARYKKRCDG